jgi:RND family efflux transporter MFP subunit
MHIVEGNVEIAEIELKNYQEGVLGEKRRLEIQVQQAKAVLEIARLQATGRKAQAEAQVHAARTLLEAEKTVLSDLKEDIGRCVIVAPGDGVAVYFVAEQARFGAGAQSVLAQGEPVREGQRLLRVADLRQMQVRVMIHEASVARLRPAREDDKTSRGQPATVRVDAFPARTLGGHLRSVAHVASPQDWLSADVKVYPAVVSFDDTIPELRPGMSAEVRIVVDERKGVLRLPVQALLTEGREKYCYVKNGNAVEKRKLTTGASNHQHVEIKEGLKEGEEVLLNPRVDPPRKDPKGPAAGREQSQRHGTADIILRSVKPADDGTSARRTFIAAYGLTQQDYERLQTIGTILHLVPERIFPHEARHGEWLHNGRVVATRQEYSEVNRLELAAGRFLVADDDAEMRNVAILGAAAAKALFPAEDPVGQTVSLGSHRYVVVGVVKDRPPALHGKAAEDSNSDIYIPLQTCNVRFGEKIFIRRGGSRTGEAVQVSQVLVTVREPSQVQATADVIASQLERFHSQKDWEVQVAGNPGGEG